MKTKKVMLITGATSGIGKALAEHYYKKNYKLFLLVAQKRKLISSQRNLKKIYCQFMLT